MFTIGEHRTKEQLFIIRSGVNPDIGTTPEDVWGVGGQQVFPSVAAAATIVSTSTADSSAGTGAQAIRIFGLDAAYGIQTEDINLSGTSTVTTSASFLRVTRIQTIRAGSTGFNEGEVTLSIGGNPQVQMLAMDNFSHNGNYTVPAKYWLFINCVCFGVESGRDVLVKIFTRSPFSNNFLFSMITSFIVSPPGYQLENTPPGFFAPTTDIVIRAQKLAGATGQLSVVSTGYLTSAPGVFSSPLPFSDAF